MKNSARVILLLMVLFSFIAASTNFSFAKETKQEKCPVMGYKINKELYVDYEGKRIYFCCPSCPEEFKKDPDKYMKKLQDEGVVLEEVPKSN